MVVADAAADAHGRASRPVPRDPHQGLRARLLRAGLPCAAWLVALASPGLARAERARADVLFDEGKALLEAKDYAAACPKLAESHRLEPGGGSALALAICREGEGKTASAFAAYGDALFYAKRDQRKDREDHATAKMIELEPRLPKLRIVVSAAAKAQGVRVALDREPLGPALEGTAAHLDPGEHELSASAPGLPTRVVKVVAVPGQTIELVVEPLVVERVAVPAVPPAVADRGLGATRTAGLVVGAVGVVGVAFGTYYGLRALSLGDDVARRCPSSPCGDRAAVDDNDRAHGYARVSDWTLLGGGSLVVVGAAMYLFGGDHAERLPQVSIGRDSAMIRWEARW